MNKVVGKDLAPVIIKSKKVVRSGGIMVVPRKSLMRISSQE